MCILSFPAFNALGFNRRMKLQTRILSVHTAFQIDPIPQEYITIEMMLLLSLGVADQTNTKTFHGRK
jgi:hypothetical protein